jgi:hypothetical protein
MTFQFFTQGYDRLEQLQRWIYLGQGEFQSTCFNVAGFFFIAALLIGAHRTGKPS